jgi:hypothetical protein
MFNRKPEFATTSSRYELIFTFSQGCPADGSTVGLWATISSRLKDRKKWRELEAFDKIGAGRVFAVEAA